MGIFDNIRNAGISYQLKDEDLFAEVYQEVANDVRRDGLWARALSDCDMDQDKAKAAYIRLRVESLREEVHLFISSLGRELADAIAEREQAAQEAIENAERRANSQVQAAELDKASALEAATAEMERIKSDAIAMEIKARDTVSEATDAQRRIQWDLNSATNRIVDLTADLGHTKNVLERHRKAWYLVALSVVVLAVLLKVDLIRIVLPK